MSDTRGTCSDGVPLVVAVSGYRDLVEAALRDGNEARACHLLQLLGHEVLAENGDWVMIHRERELKNPAYR